MKIPFSLYDIWAVLAPGFLVLLTLDQAAGTGWILKADHSLVAALFWCGAAYLMGELLAGPAEWLLEDVLVRRALGVPGLALFGHGKKGAGRLFFPRYFRPFPGAVQVAVKQRAQREGLSTEGEAFFLLIFSRVKTSADGRARLDRFLYLYSFCRNITLALWLSALLLVFAPPSTGGLSLPEPKMLAVVLVLAGLAMLYRFLKFRRQYVMDMFLAYAGQDPVPNRGVAPHTPPNQ